MSKSTEIAAPMRDSFKTEKESTKQQKQFYSRMILVDDEGSIMMFDPEKTTFTKINIEGKDYIFVFAGDLETQESLSSFILNEAKKK